MVAEAKAIAPSPYAAANRASGTIVAGLDHLPALDGARGIAILAVMLYHFMAWVPAPRGCMGALSHVAAHGEQGVGLFFVLSGFLITRILLRSVHAEGYFSKFYARRTLRIFPLYYAVLLVSLVIAPPVIHVFGGATSQSNTWELWLYLSNFGMAFGKAPSSSLVGYSHFWSLAVEEQFYLVWPLVVRHTSPRALLRLPAIGFAVAVASRVAIVLGLHGQGEKYFTFSNLDALGVGCFLAIGLQERGIVYVRRVMNGAVAVCAVVLVAIVAARAVTTGSILVFVLARPSLTAVLSGWLLANLIGEHPRRWVARGLCVRPLQSIGKYSYGMYVLHMLPVARALVDGDVAASFERVAGPQLGGIAFLLCAGVATYGAARVTWMVLERPCLDLKRFFAYEPVRATVR